MTGTLQIAAHNTMLIPGQAGRARALLTGGDGPRSNAAGVRCEGRGV
jgi:hypothetical protein